MAEENPAKEDRARALPEDLRGQAIQDHVDGHRECDRGPIPAKLDFQRVDEHGGHGGDACRHEHSQTGDGENHPVIVQTRWSEEVKHSGHSFPAMSAEYSVPTPINPKN